MRICLNMIVRNEAAVIERCLRSVRPFIDSWAIADTGSTDGTPDIVSAFLRDLQGELIERPWVDFASNRNEALALARKQGDYALFIDADDVLEPEAGFAFGELGGACYSIETIVGGISSWVETLARLDIDWSWQGVLHEVLTAPQDVEWRQLRGVRLGKHGDGARSRVGQHKKYARDAEILRAALECEPGNTRYQFYLAHSLRESGQYAAALDAYRSRSVAGGADEEVYVSKLLIGVLGAHTGMSDAQVVEAYLDAYRFRPQRAESLQRLAHFLIKRGRYAEARDYALIACRSAPTTDTEFVDPAAGGWRAADDLAIASFNLGKREECIQVCTRMLADPQLPASERERVQRNLQAAQTLPAAGR